MIARIPFYLLLLSLLLLRLGTVVAQEDPPLQSHGKSASVTPKTYRSKYFVLSTDLQEGQAHRLLNRLESTLELVSNYWQRRPRGTIRCLVAQDVSAWPESRLPHPLARIVISRIGGATFEMRIAKKNHQSMVLAASREGIAEHEIVHAFCLQTFGELGPVWYKEGMAEIAFHGRERRRGVQCPSAYVDYFRQSQMRTVDAIVHGDSFTDQIGTSLLGIATNYALSGKTRTQVPLDAWTKDHQATVNGARESYRWSWALCYFLCNNPNYAKRFRALGQSYVTGRQDTFYRAFSPVRQQLEFEYGFFMRRFDVGYQIDLCRWTWDAPFNRLATGRHASARIMAARGYQPSGVAVCSGSRYRYDCSGSWQTGEGAIKCDADGGSGQGQMEGIVLTRYRLSEPFLLGRRGSFQAPETGNLYLRCHDAWNQLGDNRGSLQIQLKLQSQDL